MTQQIEVTYIDVIGMFYTNISVKELDGGMNYDTLIHCGGDPIPPKVDLDIKMAELKKSKVWELIKEYRDTRKFKGIYVSSKWFHNDPDSRTQWLGLKDKARDALANGGTTSTVLTILHPTYGNVPISWTTMDGSSITVTVQLAFDVVEKTGDLDGVLYGIGQYHKGQLYASATPETYDYTTLWPTVYGE